MNLNELLETLTTLNKNHGKVGKIDKKLHKIIKNKFPVTFTHKYMCTRDVILKDGIVYIGSYNIAQAYRGCVIELNEFLKIIKGELRCK